MVYGQREREILVGRSEKYENIYDRYELEVPSFDIKITSMLSKIKIGLEAVTILIRKENGFDRACKLLNQFDVEENKEVSIL